MSSTDHDGPEAIAALVDQLRVELQRADGDLPDDVVQQIMLLAVQAYCRKREEDRTIRPFADKQAVSATEVMVVTASMLRALELEAFELGMWMAIGN